MKGWFDMFREDGGPTIYTNANRTPVTFDILILLVAMVFATITVGFLIIYPGVRKQRRSTFVCVSLSIFTGVALLLSRYGSSWHTGRVVINTYYQAFSSQTLHAELGVNIGLTHVNITLKALPNSNIAGDIDYNERFGWVGNTQMNQEYKMALMKGLPYPILTVAEYLAVNEAGFIWGYKYRMAGYYTGIIVWTAFSCWLLTLLLLLNVPRYGAYMMFFTGLLMVLTCVVYTLCLPTRALNIRFETAVLQMQLGWQFYLLLVAGIVYAVFGAIASIVDLLFPHTFSTIMEVDFGTPYDRHILINESEEMRRRPALKIPKLEEPITAGIEATTKLIRRLSRRGGGGGRGANDHSTDPRGLVVQPAKGLVNVAFEPDRHAPVSRQSSRHKSSALKPATGGHHLSPLSVMALESHLHLDGDGSTSVRLETVGGGGGALTDSWPSDTSAHRQLSRQQQQQQRRFSSQSSQSTVSQDSLQVPSNMSPTGAATAERLHAPLEKNDSRTSNIIVFHTQDARGDLTRRQSCDPVSMTHGDPHQ